MTRLASIYEVESAPAAAPPPPTTSEQPGRTLEGGLAIGASDRVFEDDYRLVKRLQSGSFGVVYTAHFKHTPARTHTHDNNLFAVKVIDRTKLSEKDDRSTFREIGIMRDLIDLENVVKLIDVYIVPKSFYIVQFYARGGDVFDRVSKRLSYSEMDARALSVILIKTMRDMHERRICHRDMKPENLLLKNPHDDSTILVADFGFAKYVPLPTESSDGLTTRCGTPAFVAPEILVGKPYNTQVDMWSVGCLIYMLIGGYPPFKDQTHRGLFRKIRGANFSFHHSYWKNASIESKQLITNLLTVDPDARWTAQEALSSSAWFRKDDRILSERDLSGSIREIKRFKAASVIQNAVEVVTQAFQVEKISDLLKQTDVEDDDENIDTEIATDQCFDESSSSLIEAPGSRPPPPAVHKLNMSVRKTKTFDELYEVEEDIQTGSAGVVKKCYSWLYQKDFAVKIIPRDADDARKDEQVLHEVNIMTQLHHKNLVEVVDFFEEEDYYYIVMELMAGGDVFDRIIDLQSYTEKDARDLAKIMLEAVSYMHDCGIVHRDIKPQNLLLESEQCNCAIKIGDFGFAKRVYTPKSLTTRCGTPSYVAPEILKNQPYDQSCDMWSVGVVLYVMLVGYTPFESDSQGEMFERIKEGSYVFDYEDWAHISTEARDLIQGCLNVNVDKRLTARQALQSRWIAGISDEFLSERRLSSTMRTFRDKDFRLKSLTDAFKTFTDKSDAFKTITYKADAFKTFTDKAKADLKQTIESHRKQVSELVTGSAANLIRTKKE